MACNVVNISSCYATFRVYEPFQPSLLIHSSWQWIYCFPFSAQYIFHNLSFALSPLRFVVHIQYCEHYTAALIATTSISLNDSRFSSVSEREKGVWKDGRKIPFKWKANWVLRSNTYCLWHRELEGMARNWKREHVSSFNPIFIASSYFCHSIFSFWYNIVHIQYTTHNPRKCFEDEKQEGGGAIHYT